MKMIRNYSILLSIFLIIFTFPLQLIAKNLDQFIVEEMNNQKISGLAAAIVKGEELIWSKGYGIADKEQNTLVDDNTIFLIASVSKTVTAVALMKLYEQGLFNLDDNVSNYLPFPLVHPNFPDTPITFRMLLTATSGISDKGYDELDLYAYEQDSPISLASFLKNYFEPSGKYYDRRKNFGAKPGTRHDYTNIGVALIGYLVECISNLPFDVYCNYTIFAPLQMTNTAWFLKDLPRGQMAMPYNRKGNPIGQYTFPDYPNGQLRTSVVDLSRFLRMFMEGGTLQGVQILQPQTIHLMSTVAFPQIDRKQGLIWFYQRISDKKLLGHDGSEKGVTTTMFFNPKTAVGGIVLTNKDDADLDEILAELIKTGEDQ